MGYWIVVVDDEPLCLTETKRLLSEHDMRVSCLRSGRDLIKFIENNTPDLILLDVIMPEMDGFETFNRLRYLEDKMARKRTPVIFLTSDKDNESEQRGLRMGASDFIHKPINDVVVISRIINSIKNQKTIDSLKEEATIDKLTGFYNKDSGTKRIADHIIFSTGALMMFDLDNFKLVNDLFGHDMGDEVLRAFSDIVRDQVRETDIIA
ncbi:MAG: response regulator, partial [Lachnospiraceae bacterium]|nr:response regulator [Lachnospiraceae bacterium]